MDCVKFDCIVIKCLMDLIIMVIETFVILCV